VSEDALTPSTQAGSEGLFFVQETISPDQRRTLPARLALASKFKTPEQKREHYRAMGARSAAGRVVLRTDEAAALVDAYSLLSRIAERARVKLGDLPTEAA
jgi:hypothetical protein